MRCLLLLLLTTPLVLLSSCALKSQNYVDLNLGFSSTKGTIVRVDNIGCDLSIKEGRTHLKNGIVLEVDRPGGTATLQIGDNFQRIDLPVGSRVVFAPEGDYVLQPLALTSEPLVPQP